MVVKLKTKSKKKKPSPSDCCGIVKAESYYTKGNRKPL